MISSAKALSWASATASICHFIVAGIGRIIKEFWKCYSEAVNVGKAQAHMLSKMNMLDNKPVNLAGFSLGTLVAYYTAVNIKEKNRICDLYLLGSVLDKNEFL